MAEVKIYSSRFCGYCTRAKRLLETKGIDYIEIAVDSLARNMLVAAMISMNWNMPVNLMKGLASPAR
jgi:glutaredoxin